MTAAHETDSRLDNFVARYRRDHSNRVNHILHVGVGWPLVALAVIVAPFRPLLSVGLVILAYAIMFTGHFVFEKNKPTILERPLTPFVMAWAVIRGLAHACASPFRRAKANRSET